jgi:hypothetical protein
MNSQCNCKNGSRVRILAPDGKKIADGLLKLTPDSSDGWFDPDAEFYDSNSLKEKYSELLADATTHKHQLRNWGLQLNSYGHPSLTFGSSGDVIINHRFYFEVIPNNK